jgi:hypothetical protein
MDNIQINKIQKRRDFIKPQKPSGSPDSTSQIRLIQVLNVELHQTARHHVSISTGQCSLSGVCLIYRLTQCFESWLNAFLR